MKKMLSLEQVKGYSFYIMLSLLFMSNAKQFGTSFSHHELIERGLDWKDALEELKGLGFNFVRLGVYWSEVEQSEGKFDFSILDQVFDSIQGSGLNVLLTVGMKAPRYPEFYIPQWADPQSPHDAEISKDQKLKKRALSFAKAAVAHFKNRDEIVAWQIENEPMDRSGDNRYFIGADYVTELAQIIRSLDSQKRTLVVNCWCDIQSYSSAPWTDDTYCVRNALDIGDVLGLDIYPRVGSEQTFYYRRTVELPTKYIGWAKDKGKEAWVIESQAEPWSPSGYDADAIQWLVDRHIEQGFKTITLWGFEWWYEQKIKGDNSLIEHVKWEAKRFLNQHDQ